MIVEVNDDGPGADENVFNKLIEELNAADFSESRHYGLKNVNDRTRIFYGSEYELEFKNRRPEGFTVRMMLPYVEGVTF